MLAELIGAKFVQEVTAVSLAVEKLHPEVYSVIELGGQDAKIIVFKDDNESGRKKKIPSMNDKCAGGTGAVIDKINAKLKIPAEELSDQGYHGIKLHKVAGKVRRVRRDRHQRPAESRHAAGSVDGFAVRRHRAAEPERAHARPHAAAARSAAGRTEHFHPRHARSLASEHSAHVGGAQSRNSRRREAGRADQGSAERAVFRGARRDRIRQGRRRLRRLLPRLRQARSTTSSSGARKKKPSPADRAWSKSDDELATFREQYAQEIHSGDFPEGPDRRRIRRHRRRVHFHQSRAARRKWRHPLQVLSALERQSDSGHDRDVREPSRSGRSAGRQARSARRRHHRLREGYS